MADERDCVSAERVTVAGLRRRLAAAPLQDELRRTALSLQTEQLLVDVMNLPSDQKAAFVAVAGHIL